MNENMKRKPILNFFDIASDVDLLPENELFKLKGGDSDIAWETEGPEIDVYPPDGGGDDDNWDDGGDDGPEDPWDDEWDEDWDGDDHGDGGTDNDEEEQPKCTCIKGIVGLGSGGIVDYSNHLGTFRSAITADLNNPNTNQAFKDTLNGLNQIFNRIENSNFNLVINFGDADGSAAYTSLSGNKDVKITMDQSELVYEKDEYLAGTEILLHKKGDLNYAAFNEVLAHELKHVEQFLDGRIGFNMFDNEIKLKYGIEDEVEAFAFANNYATFGNPPVEINETWVKNQTITVTGADGQPQTIKPYANLGDGGNCPVHGVSSNPN